MNIVKSKNVYFTSIRLTDWLHALGLPVLGVVYYSKTDLWTYNAFLSLIISSLYLAHGYSLNTYFDAYIDPYWKKRLFYPGQKSFKKIILFSYLILVINCIISLSHSLLMFYLVIIGSFTGLIYSSPPFSFKRIIPLNIILNSLGFSILFTIGFVSVSKVITVSSIVMTVFFGLIFIPMQIIHQMSHYDIDKKAKIRTFCNVYGLKTAFHFFNFSLILIVLWALAINIRSGDTHMYLFYLTCVFTLALFYSMKKLKIKRDIDISTAGRVRLMFRKICMVYGLVLFFLFYLH